MSNHQTNHHQLIIETSKSSSFPSSPPNSSPPSLSPSTATTTTTTSALKLNDPTYLMSCATKHTNFSISTAMAATMSAAPLSSSLSLSPKSAVNNSNNNKPLSSASIKITDINDLDSVKLFAFAICREYLGGVWKEVEFAKFTLEKLTGGLSNYIFKCKINDEKLRPVKSEPTSVLLRLYGENHQNNSSIMLKDVVVSALMGDQKLGPKLYGIFSAGRLEEFIEANEMQYSSLRDPNYSRKIASIMARFHSLQMPFIKEPHWLFETTKRYIKQSKEVTFSSESDLKRYHKLMSFNLDQEFSQLKKKLVSINSPVVFCHNDIQAGNILKLADDKLIIIDYEYGSYNYRGFDLGNHFCEWMFYNSYDKYPYFLYDYAGYPSKEQQLLFIRAYVEQIRETRSTSSSDIDYEDDEDDDDDIDNDDDLVDENNTTTDSNNNSSNSSNSKSTPRIRTPSTADKRRLQKINNHDGDGDQLLNEEKLCVEANYFALASHLFWALWSISQAASSKITFDYLEYALARCDAYFKQKQIYFPSGY